MVDFLRAHSVDEYAHSHTTLLAHLVGVHVMLRSWAMPETVCNVGLFHSIYGTDVYKDQALPVALRAQVASYIGAEAERLVYLFCIMERQSLFDCLSQAPPRHVRCRLSGIAHELTDTEFCDLCVLTLANWLEQRPRFPPTQRNARRREFYLMRPYLPGPARAALDEAYGFR